jgi:hypothetical protein
MKKMLLILPLLFLPCIVQAERKEVWHKTEITKTNYETVPVPVNILNTKNFKIEVSGKNGETLTITCDTWTLNSKKTSKSGKSVVTIGFTK